MKNNSVKIIRQVRFLSVFLFVFALGGTAIFSHRTAEISKAEVSNESGIEPSATPRPRRVRVRVTRIRVPQTRRADQYSRFQHATHTAQKLACDACHKVPTANWDKVRSKETAFPDVTDFPKHDACINCHRREFFSGRPPSICANCHINPSPTDSARFPFPNPREIFDASPKGKTAESAFQISFPHDKHIEIVSRNENPFRRGQENVFFVNAASRREDSETSCKVCHQTYQPQGDGADEYFISPPKNLGDKFWLKKGTFKTSPIGHTTCFSCHNADSGIAPAPNDCAACHKPKENLPATDFDAKYIENSGINDKITIQTWRRRVSSGTFRHEWMSHNDLSCSSCHNVAAMNTTDFKTRRVAISSCDNCHITSTLADGGVLNTEIEARKKDVKFECVKCHLNYGKMPIPESHLKAIGAGVK